MLAKRLIASLSVSHRPSSLDGPKDSPHDLAGTPAYAQAADELMLVAEPDSDISVVVQRLGEMSGLVPLPVTVFARTSTREDLDKLMLAGAERVYLWATDARVQASDAITRWGSPAIGVAIVLQIGPDSDWRVFPSDDLSQPCMTLDDVEAMAAGAGELLVLPHDTDLGACVRAMRLIVDRVDVPVTVAGRTRTTEGLRRMLIDGGVGGLVFEPDSIEEFESVAQIKTYLAAAGIVVRGA